jgi:hypothetical protein
MTKEGVEDVIDPAEYGDIGAAYLKGFGKPHSLDLDELEKLGREIVKRLYKGDFKAAKAKFLSEAVLNENKQEAADELQMIMDQLYELSDQAKMIFRNNFPGEYSRLDAYGALDFGTSSNRYDVTLEGTLENLDMEDDDEDMMQEDMDLGHQDNEPGMLKGDLYKIGKYSMELYQMMDDLENVGGEVDFPHWWQSKIITAKNMISGAKHYLDFELKEPAIDAVVDATIDVVDEEAIDEISQNEGIFDRFRKRSIKGTVDKEPYYFDIADKALLYLQKQDKEWRKYKLASVGPGDKKTHIRMALSHKTNHKTADPEFMVYHDKNDNIEKVVELSIAETIDAVVDATIDVVDEDTSQLGTDGDTGFKASLYTPNEMGDAAVDRESASGAFEGIARKLAKQINEEEPGEADKVAANIQKAMNKHKKDDAKMHQLKKARTAMNKGDLSKAEKIAKRLAEKLKNN